VAQAADRNGIVQIDRLNAQAAESLGREARRLHRHAERARALYRRRLGTWLQLRARLDQGSGSGTNGANAAGAGPSSAANTRAAATEDLRAEHETLVRELAQVQHRLKRLEVAARQLDLVVHYLSATDPTAAEPTLDTTDDSAAGTALRIIQAQEQERQRLAEEIHDGPAQVLTNAIFQVEYLDRVVGGDPRQAATRPAPTAQARTELALLRNMLRDGLEEVRGTIATLRPPAVDVGLAAALREAATEFQARNAITARVDVEGIDAGLSPSARASVLRITQEALQNVRKHAAATEVRISLDGNQLVIADNGRGFDVMRLATGVTRNFGLQFMRERADLMGSELHVESRQGEGTRILLRLPEPSR
jgi:two-component system sensor histidine kinase DegS